MNEEQRDKAKNKWDVKLKDIYDTPQTTECDELEIADRISKLSEDQSLDDLLEIEDTDEGRF